MSGAAVAARAPVWLGGPAPSSSARHRRYPPIRPRTGALVRASASAVDAQQAEYASWRESRSIKSPNVEVAYFGDVDDEVMRYRGVKATSAINAGDVLVELPRESCLVLMDDAELPFPEFCTNELWAKLTEQNKWAVKVALNLLHERSLGEASPFRMYIDQLPKQFDLLSQWSDDELRLLQYPAVARAAEGQRKEDDDAFELVRKHSPETLKNPAVTKESLVWALNMVRSRVFSGRLSDNARTKKNLLPKALAAGTAFAAFLTSQTQEGRWLAVFAMLALVVFDKEPEPGEEGGAKLAYVLMPLIDAFNHADLPEKTEFEFSASAFRLRAPANVAPDEEIFISYGALGNDELLTRYGFVASDTSETRGPANDTYVFQGLAAWLDANHEPSRRAKGADPSRAEKIRDARLETYVSQGVFRADGSADANLEWALRCALATPEEWEKAGGTCDGFKLGGGAPEKRAREALAAACAARLAAMETSVAEDEAALASGDVKDRARVAVQYRLAKKRILSRAVQKYA